MAYYKTYQGEFLSKGGARYRAEIWTERESSPGRAADLSFPAESPLTIEWFDTALEEPICSSTATLTIISPGDRTYIDLYSIRVPAARLDVYRNNELYWTGTLDPEFYEEPYERASDYDVSLTFNDFGVLDRLKYPTTEGMVSVGELLNRAMELANLGALTIDTSMVSTETEGAALDLSRLYIQSANFFDEDGEASTIKEALTACLQPFGLKMQQRGGGLYIYDLNGLHSAGTAGEIYWTGTSQLLSAGRVANDVRVTFSPYSTSSAMNITATYKGKTPGEWVGNQALVEKPDGSKAISLLSSFDQGDKAIQSLTLYVGDGKGAAEVYGDAAYFKTAPLLGGASQEEGILYGALVSRNLYDQEPVVVGNNLRAISDIPYLDYYNLPRKNYKTKAYSTGSPGRVFTTKRVYLPPGSSMDAILSLKLETLIGLRNNPWGDDNYNFKEEEDQAASRAGWIFIPISVNLYRSKDDETAYYHFDNSLITKTWMHPFWRRDVPNFAAGRWRPGHASYGDMWLSYYDGEDMKEKSPLGSWMTNRHNLGRNDKATHNFILNHTDYFDGTLENPKGGYDPLLGEGRLERVMNEMPDGEFLPYPPMGGWLEITVWEGIAVHDYDNRAWEVAPPEYVSIWANLESKHPYFAPSRNENAPSILDQWFDCPYWNYYHQVHWLLYKLPTVEIVSNDLAKSEIEKEDIERTGVINPDASEHISISTTVGTADTPLPGARGLAFYMTDGALHPLGECTRAGHTDAPENLLIGTIISQFAERHTRLSGEASPLIGRVATYTERCQGDRAFIPLSETQDLIEGTAELTVTELSPEDYTAIEEIPEE